MARIRSRGAHRWPPGFDEDPERGIQYADPSVRTNRRIPPVRELVELLEQGFSGR
jgi:hypothetical protein